MSKKINIDNMMEQIDFNALRKECYENALNDKTDFKNWFEDIRCLYNVFVIPHTGYFTLSQEWFDWLKSDHYEEDAIERFSNEIVVKSPSHLFELPELFMKTGMFSGKFNFSDCHVKKKDYKDIGKKFLNIFYSSSLLGCPESPVVVLREFIHTSVNRPCIYNGMKLNTEARLFYDFNKKKVVGIFNYWDRDTMINNLWDDKDKETFKSVIDEIEADFDSKKLQLCALAEEHLKKVPNINGIWSVDFMFIDNNKFALIDMAPMEKSYYADKLKL